MLTAIEPSDATMPLAAAIARQERMLAPGTFEATGLGAGAMGSAFVGALAGTMIAATGVRGSVTASVGLGGFAGGTEAAGELIVGLVGASPPSGLTFADGRAAEVVVGALSAQGVQYRYRLALPAVYPLAAPTWTAATVNEASPHRALATIALRPLLEPTPPTGMPRSALSASPLRAPLPMAEHEPIVAQTGGTVGSGAYRTFAELAGWLGMTQAQTAALLGIGRTTPLAWRRGHEPRPRRARRLYQTHALVNTLVRRVGLGETRLWLERGSPSPLELIGAGDVTAADDRAQELIFGAPSTAPTLDAWRPDEPENPKPVGASAPPLRMIRRAAPRRRSP